MRRWIIILGALAFIFFCTTVYFAFFAAPENYILENDYAKIVDFAFQNTAEGCSCLLSPAAASYDQFKDFTVRGKTFKELVLHHKK